MNFTIPQTDFATIGSPLVLVVWASVLVLADLFISNKRTTAWLALLGLVASVIVPFFAPSIPRTSFGGMVILDDLAIAIDIILVLVTAITILFSIDYLKRQTIEMGEFYPLLLFTTAAMMTMAHGRNLIVLFIALEWLSIGLYILAGFAYPRIRSQEAAMKYLLYGAFTAGFLIYGIALLYGATGTVDLQGIADQLRATPALRTSPLLLTGLGLVLIGFGYKISMVPFHMWTPDVYEGSPTPVSAYMSAATKAAGFAALLRVLQTAFPDLLATWQIAVAILAALTMVIGNVAAVMQSNIKRMLAYSSIAHAGFILCAIVALNVPNALQSFVYYILAYALTNLGAFAVVIALEQAGEERFDIADLAGIGWRQPLLGITMAIFMLSLAGVPPLAGFFAKWLVFQVAYQAGFWWLVLIGLLSSVISAFYYLRIIVNMYMRDSTQPSRSFTTASLLIGVAVAAVIVVVQGVLLNPVVNLLVGQAAAAAR